MTHLQAKKLGSYIATARRGRGWSYRQLEEQTGLPRSWMFRIERGDYTAPDPARLTRIAEMLELDPERIDRLTHGQVAASLPTVRTYFRAKYDLAPEQLDRIERYVKRVTGGDVHDQPS